MNLEYNEQNSIPSSTPELNHKGLINKYTIAHTDGHPVDSEAIYFVLRLDNGASYNHYRASMYALMEYAISIRSTNPILADDLESKYVQPWIDNRLNNTPGKNPADVFKWYTEGEVFMYKSFPNAFKDEK